MNTESIPESNVYKMGFVVSNIEEAMGRYGKLYKIDKWYRVLREPGGEGYLDGGFDGDGECEIVVGFTRRMEIDLIVTSGGSNIYAAFMRENGEGLHHLSFCVRDIKAAMEDYEKLGYEVVSKGKQGKKRSRRYYVFMSRHGDPNSRVIELVEMRFGSLRIMHPPRSMLYSIMSGSLEPIDR